MRFIARAPPNRRSGGVRVFQVVSGIQTHTDSDVQSPVDRRGLSEIERNPFRESDDYAFHIGRHTIVARNVCYV